MHIISFHSVLFLLQELSLLVWSTKKLWGWPQNANYISCYRLLVLSPFTLVILWLNSVVLVILPFLDACMELLLWNGSQILIMFSLTSSSLSDFLSSNSGFSLANRKNTEEGKCGSMEDVVSQECCFQIFSYMHSYMEKGVIGDEAK